MNSDKTLIIIFVAVVLLVILIVAFFIWDAFKNPKSTSNRNKNTQYVYIKEKENDKKSFFNLADGVNEKRKGEEERKKRIYDIEKAIRNSRS